MSMLRVLCPQSLETRLVQPVTPTPEYCPENIIKPELLETQVTLWFPQQSRLSSQITLKLPMHFTLLFSLHHLKCSSFLLIYDIPQYSILQSLCKKCPRGCSDFCRILAFHASKISMAYIYLPQPVFLKVHRTKIFLAVIIKFEHFLFGSELSVFNFKLMLFNLGQTALLCATQKPLIYYFACKSFLPQKPFSFQA